MAILAGLWSFPVCCSIPRREERWTPWSCIKQDHANDFEQWWSPQDLEVQYDEGITNIEHSHYGHYHNILLYCRHGTSIGRQNTWWFNLTMTKVSFSTVCPPTAKLSTSSSEATSFSRWGVKMPTNNWTKTCFTNWLVDGFNLDDNQPIQHSMDNLVCT